MWFPKDKLASAIGLARACRLAARATHRPIVQPRRSRRSAFGLGVLLAAISGAPVLADDTEVFKAQLTAQQSAALKPNVLFVLDTSGSMSSGVPGTPMPYDPGTTYNGGGNPCLATRLYWSTTGTTPNCSTNQFFEKSKFRCDDGLSVLDPGGTGVYQDRIARYQTSTQDWRSLGTTSALQDPPHVECQNDRGVHGQTTGAVETHITTGSSNPWQQSPLGETNWELTGDFYTVYSGNYMNYFNNPTGGNPTRIDIVKAATNTILGANKANINAGLMRFDTRTYCDFFVFGFCGQSETGNIGGPVVFPITNISAAADLLALQAQVTGLNAAGFTPLAETLYEAYLYFKGAAPLYGTNPPTPNNIQSVSSSMSGGTYVSPITLECQKNHIVYLTDGDPTYDGQADGPIGTLLTSSGPNISDTACDHVGFDGGDNCLDELSEVLAEEDHSNLTGTQSVNVYTIGFLTNQTLLANAATKGNGEYFTANDAMQLSEAFQSILTNIQEQTATFSAPSVSVNAFNRITNRDELFFSLFTPTNRARWPGNIKRYQLDCVTEDTSNPGFCTDGDSNGFPDPPVIVDADGDAAVDAITGFFKATSRSVWTPAVLGDDGEETVLGGAANVFGGITPNDNQDAGAGAVPDPRVVYTYTGAYANSGGTFTPTGTDVLSNAAHLVATTNTALNTEADTNADGDPESFFYPTGRDASAPSLVNLIRWVQGIDVLDADTDALATDARHQLGDGLHTEPVLIGYGSTAANPDITLYTLNNDGYLHAIDIDDGTEVFSFMPQESLARVPELFQDAATSAGKSYGIDGPLTVWFNDKDGDGILDSGSPNNETVYLFFGMRRGGQTYYAVDVTSRTAPRLLWKIQGGIPGTNFAELGQTWSAMKKARVKLNNVVRDVLIFAGGYDPQQDNATLPIDDTKGRAIYMVDATTGALIWHAGPSSISPAPNLVLAKMTNSIPSDINVFDITGDGLDDRFYVGDMRGQVWRFDINNASTTATNLVTGSLLASLQQSNATDATIPAEDNRRFYFRPDVTLATPEDNQPFLAITIGSGYRARPNNAVIRDRFYMIRDPNVGNITTYPATVYEDDLADITDDLTPSATTLFGTTSNPVLGWRLELRNLSDAFVGEKVLAESIVFNNNVLFTTFTPPSTALTADCKPNQGAGRVFQINLFSGAPNAEFQLDTSNPALTRSDRSLSLIRGGIPPGVVILFSKMNGVVPVGFVAAEQLNLGFSDAPVKTYWFQQETQ